MATHFSKKESSRQATWISIGLATGCGIGVLIGALTDNLGLWLPLGVCGGMAIGTAIGSILDAREKNKKEL